MMTCEDARALLFAEQEGVLEDDERRALHAHLNTCAACRAEEAALRDSYAVLAGGLRALAAPVAPSPAFWQHLSAGLDAVDAERERERSGKAAWPRSAGGRGPIAPQSATRPGWRRHWIAVGALLAALVTGALASGAPQQAWAALRHWLYFVPLIGLSSGVGQVEPTALVAVGPATASNGAITLTVTGLVAGRRATLVAYRLSGPTLGAPGTGGTAPVADAVDATLIGAQGRRYVVTAWLPIQRSVERGVPQVRGLLAFRPLAARERAVQLVAARMPLAPLAPHPWSLQLPLQPASSGAAQTSVPLSRGDTHRGIRVSVTDVTFLAHATVIDMETALTGPPFAGGSVVSLTPEQAVSAFAPVLSTGRGGILTAMGPALPAPVRQALLPRPEFIFGPVGNQRSALSLTVPAVELRMPGRASLTARRGMPPSAITVGSFTLSLAQAQVVTPPAALGLDGEKRLRLAFVFPPSRAGGTLESVDTVVDGVRRTISRDHPQVELPLAAGQREVLMAVENPLIAVRGPWMIALSGQGTT